MFKTSIKIDKSDWDRVMRKLNVSAFAIPLERVVADGAVILRQEIPRRFVRNVAAGIHRGQLNYGVSLIRTVYIIERHPIILNHGGRGKKSLFRLGPRVGRRTRNWYTGIVRLKAVKDKINALLERAKHELEREWTD